MGESSRVVLPVAYDAARSRVTVEGKLSPIVVESSDGAVLATLQEGERGVFVSTPGFRLPGDHVVRKAIWRREVPS
jgi:hypothetical protein